MYEPNYDASPIEIDGRDVTPGASIVRTTDGKPAYTIIDTQKGGGKGFPDGLVIKPLDQDSLTFITAQVIEGMVSTGEYMI